jgi:thiamine kinase-like enzyme
MIPENKKTAVANALQSAFGVSEFEDIAELTAGLSTALVFKIVVLGKPYLLKIITRTDAVSDPTHHYASMKAAGEAGIGPRVWYMNLADRISITDFIEAKPLSINDAKQKLPEMLRRLHVMPAFPYRMNYLEKMDGFVQKFRAACIMPEDMSAELFKYYGEIKKVYPNNLNELVSCHNDLKPENILFDGERVLVIDWEAVFLNDRYLDLAVVANFVTANEQDEKEYLKNYFGEALNEYHHARLFLMQQILHVFYFTFLMLTFNPANKQIDFSMPKPGFREFHDLMWKGKISLINTEAKLQYALVHLEQLFNNIKLKRFEDSLSVVAGYKPA